MPVPTALSDISATAASNFPSGSESVGSSLDDYLRGIGAVLRGNLAHKGADIASATTTDLGAVTGLFHDITGTTTITGFGTVSAGVWKVLKFEGALTLTHNATSLILPGAANITTADGDIAIVISEGSGNWRCVSYQNSAAGVSSQWTTGDVKLTLKTTADTGWVLFNDGTIGSATSGATTRANADCEDLFTLLWTNTTDGNCAVSTGRGASAAADWAANKTIALPKALGRALAVYGAGSGLTSRALANATGSENAVVVSHTHTFSGTSSGASNDHTHSLAGGDIVLAQTGGAGTSLGPTTGSWTSISSTQGQSADHTHTYSGTTSDGSGAASGTGANMQPTVFLNVMVKL